MLHTSGAFPYEGYGWKKWQSLGNSKIVRSCEIPPPAIITSKRVQVIILDFDCHHLMFKVDNTAVSSGLLTT